MEPSNENDLTRPIESGDAHPGAASGGPPPGEPPGEPPVEEGGNRRGLVIGLLAGIVLLVILLGVLLFSGGDDEAATTTSSTTSTSTSTSTTSTSTSTTSTSTTTTTTTTSSTTTTIPAPTLVLGPDGLGVVSFGQSQATVISVVSDAVGAPTDEGPQSECPVGNDYRVRWGGLFLDFRGGSFVGWDYRGGAPPLATAQGITVGSTIGEARAAWPGLGVSVTSLGPQFTADLGGGRHISGLTTGTTDADAIDTLWSGEICIFD